MDTIHPNRDQEISICKSSFIHFCHNYLCVRNQDGLPTQFLLHRYQQRYARALDAHPWLIAKKFRQGGYSTLTVLWLFWKAMFNRGEKIAVLVKKDRDCLWFKDVVDYAVQNMPDWLRPHLKLSNGHKVEFMETDSSIQFLCTDNLVAKSFNRVFIDEAAYFMNHEVWKELFPTIHDGSCIIVSTPHKKDDWFAAKYMDAQEYINKFSIFEASYREHPNYNNPEWVKETRKNLGEYLFRVEVLQEFLPSKKEWFLTTTPKPEDWFAVNTPEEADKFMEERNTVVGSQPELRKKAYPRIDLEEFFDLAQFYEDDAKRQFGTTDDLVDPERPEPKVTVVEFERLTQDQVHSLFEMEHKHWSPARDSHPEFDDFKPSTSRELADAFGDFEGIGELWKERADMWDRRMEELEQRVNYMLARTDRNWANSTTYGQVAVIDKIREDFATLQKADIMFIENRLCVNGVPTTIEEEPLNNTYLGLSNMWGHERAVELLSSIVGEKLKVVF